MKSALALSFLSTAFALPSPQTPSSIREATTCPSLNNGQVLSNHNRAYKLHCAKQIDSSESLRITYTENGYKSCLTACDGLIGCAGLQFLATDDAQLKGYCGLFPTSALTDADDGDVWLAAVPIETQPERFGGVAIRSGSEIHFASVNGNGQKFWLYKDTDAYCPESTVGEEACESSNDDPQTIFHHAKNSTTLSLDVSVPGGQQVYVTSEGELKFTQAHSANTGNGSFTEGFDVVDGALKFEKEDFFACPLSEDEDGAYGVWAVSRVKGSNAGAGCLEFLFRAQEVEEDVENVWQYI